MANTIEICNRALTKIGSSRILSLSDDVKAARALSAIYDLTRQTELQAHPWIFAMTRAQLPALSTAPAFGWQRAYQLPSDCLRVVQLGEHWVLYQPDVTLFELEGQTVLTDESSPLRIRYISDITNAGLFSPLFAEALACRLAAEVAEELTQSLSKREAAEQAYRQAITIARRANAIQLPPQPTTEGTWLLAQNQRRG